MTMILISYTMLVSEKADLKIEVGYHSKSKGNGDNEGDQLRSMQCLSQKKLNLK